jgi:hypothetical protein
VACSNTELISGTVKISRQMVGLLGPGIDPLEGLCLDRIAGQKNTGYTKPQVGFEPTIPGFELSQTVFVLESAAGRCDQRGTSHVCKQSSPCY